MAFFRNRRPHKNHHGERRVESPDASELSNPETTGSEVAYLQSLVESRATVTVVLKTGERLRGRIRYYDRDCFSVGPLDGSPKIFLRKSSVGYIEE